MDFDVSVSMTFLPALTIRPPPASILRSAATLSVAAIRLPMMFRSPDPAVPAETETLPPSAMNPSACWHLPHLPGRNTLVSAVTVAACLHTVKVTIP